MKTTSRRACRTLALVAAVAGCRPSAPAPPTSRHPLLEQALPRIDREALDGRRVDTDALRGSVVVLDFFAEFCEPCARTLPELRALSLDEPKIAVLGVAEDERAADAGEMVTRYSLPFPVVHDRGHVLSGRFRVNELPATFIADENGKLRWFAGPEQGTGAAAAAARALLDER